MDTTFRVVPRYLQGPATDLFLIEYQPLCTAQGTVVFVQSFAEELNRSRKMLSRQARALAAAGFHSIIADLSGTGDSYGDFADVTWSAWRADLQAVLRDAGTGDERRVFLLAHRFGALLAADVLRETPELAKRLLIWSPVLSGQAFITQFLRLRLMSSLVGKSEGKESVADLKSLLQSGAAVEVAGYRLSPALFESLCNLELGDLLASTQHPIDWFEIVSREGGSLPLQASKLLASLEAAGRAVSSATAEGPKFWTTVETTVCDELVKETVLAAQRGIAS